MFDNPQDLSKLLGRLPPVSGEHLGDQETEPKPQEIDLSGLDEADLVALRGRIESLLPTRSLKDLDMERELVLQLITVQQLQRDVLKEEDIPANQKAQTVNAVAASLATLAKLQNEVFTSERLKRLERVLIETIQTLPPETQEDFLAEYEKALS